MTDISRRAVASDALIRAIRLGGAVSLLPIAASAAPPPETSGSGRLADSPEVANVLAAGAVGDGKTDDTQAFRSALAAAKTVYVPPGTYRITDTVVVDGRTLFGAGPHSILKCDNTRFSLLDVGGTGTRIHGLSLWGAATDETTVQYGVVTSTTSPPRDLAFSDLRFSGESEETGLNNGIKFEDKATDCRISNCHFERLIGKTSGHGYAILTGAVDGLVVVGNIFEGSRERSQGRHAVYVSAGGKRVTAAHNVIREFNCEAMSTNAYAHQQPVEQVIFAHNVISRCGGEGSNQSSIGIIGKARTIRVDGNIVYESFGCGILCDSGSVTQENISVDGNTVIDSAYFGIRQIGALQQTVRDNFVRGSSRINPGKWADIVVGAGVFAPEQILVTGNQCVPVPGISGRSFVLNGSPPLPLSVKIFGNDFPAKGYRHPADYAVGVLQPLIDGRLQLRTRWQPPPLVEKAAATFTFEVAGAEPGDVVVCSHPALKAGILLTGCVEAIDNVVVTLVNISGGNRIFAAGTLAVDVWKGSIPAT